MGDRGGGGGGDRDAKYHNWIGKWLCHGCIKYQIGAKFATSSNHYIVLLPGVQHWEYPHQCLKFTVDTVTHSLSCSIWYNCPPCDAIFSCHTIVPAAAMWMRIVLHTISLES